MPESEHPMDCFPGFLASQHRVDPAWYERNRRAWFEACCAELRHYRGAGFSATVAARCILRHRSRCLDEFPFQDTISDRGFAIVLHQALAAVFERPARPDAPAEEVPADRPGATLSLVDDHHPDPRRIGGAGASTTDA